MTFLLAFIIWQVRVLSVAPGFNDPKGSIGPVVMTTPRPLCGEDHEDDVKVGQSGALDIDKPQILTIMRDWTTGLRSWFCFAVCCVVLCRRMQHCQACQTENEGSIAFTRYRPLRQETRITAMPAISRTIALSALALLTACVTEPVTIPVESGVVHTGAPVQTEPEACMAQLGADNSELYNQLDSTDIRLVNWNIQKGGDPEWVSDLNTITVEPDLMTLQEAALNTDAWSDVGAEHYRSFAPGYLTRRSLTGVMTISSAEPLTQCNLTSVEPWLRSPKATIITEYGLTGTDLTLLVVNLHAVNFTFGASDFREQIQQMQTVISAHEGPMLLSGDFNTWGWRRARILQEMTDSLDLEMLDYEVDHRKRIFGKVLDRIYTRGLTVMESTTQRVDSSDHNPMSVRMRL